MDIANLMEDIPNSIKKSIIDYQGVCLKNDRLALRVILDRVLSIDEQDELAKCSRVVGPRCVAHYKYAPEIKRSYFYLPY